MIFVQQQISVRVKTTSFWPLQKKFSLKNSLRAFLEISFNFFCVVLVCIRLVVMCSNPFNNLLSRNMMMMTRRFKNEKLENIFFV